jgi:hypothetical protein
MTQARLPARRREGHATISLQRRHLDDVTELDRVQTFRLSAPRPEVESACRRALRNVDWQELPTDTFKVEPPDFAGQDLIWLLGLIPLLRQRLARVGTRTRVAPPPSSGADAVVYGVWRQVVLVTITLRDWECLGTEVTIAGQGGPPGKAAAAVGDLRRSIEIQSGSLDPSRRPQP